MVFSTRNGPLENSRRFLRRNPTRCERRGSERSPSRKAAARSSLVLTPAAQTVKGTYKATTSVVRSVAVPWRKLAVSQHQHGNITSCMIVYIRNACVLNCLIGFNCLTSAHDYCEGDRWAAPVKDPCRLGMRTAGALRRAGDMVL
jgi:hypothetical protein